MYLVIWKINNVVLLNCVNVLKWFLFIVEMFEERLLFVCSLLLINLIVNFMYFMDGFLVFIIIFVMFFILCLFLGYEIKILLFVKDWLIINDI